MDRRASLILFVGWQPLRVTRLKAVLGESRCLVGWLLGLDAVLLLLFETDENVEVCLSLWSLISDLRSSELPCGSKKLFIRVYERGMFTRRYFSHKSVNLWK